LERFSSKKIECELIRDPKVVSAINKIFVKVSRKIAATTEFI
jgi:hypothetical protein